MRHEFVVDHPHVLLGLVGADDHRVAVLDPLDVVQRADLLVVEEKVLLLLGPLALPRRLEFAFEGTKPPRHFFADVSPPDDGHDLPLELDRARFAQFAVFERSRELVHPAKCREEEVDGHLRGAVGVSRLLRWDSREEDAPLGARLLVDSL